jgi:LmbE family N-acetylglucosaminyl deacetylase
VVDAVGGPVLGIDDPDAFGTLAPPPTNVIDVRAVAARKLQALKCHASQVTGGAFERLGERDAARLLGVEQFRRASIGAQGATVIESL